MTQRSSKNIDGLQNAQWVTTTVEDLDDYLRFQSHNSVGYTRQVGYTDALRQLRALTLYWPSALRTLARGLRVECVQLNMFANDARGAGLRTQVRDFNRRMEALKDSATRMEQVAAALEREA